VKLLGLSRRPSYVVTFWMFGSGRLIDRAMKNPRSRWRALDYTPSISISSPMVLLSFWRIMLLAAAIFVSRQRGGHNSQRCDVTGPRGCFRLYLVRHQTCSFFCSDCNRRSLVTLFRLAGSPSTMFLLALCRSKEMPPLPLGRGPSSGLVLRQPPF